MSEFTDAEWEEIWENHEAKKEELEELGILPDTILVIADDNGKFIDLENDSNGYVIYHKDSKELKKIQKLLGDL